ncbi:unnamed protein product [Prorocentrum cordatum]|uniref:CMP/dCMP-type deaminase domain-containing protein n=1 Tax=Prorocentrum cordatum TaxID=2364126 RepID=A0ABN9XJE3_9DINO|nr:unnamed protein product [Polarella glacialis]
MRMIGISFGLASLTVQGWCAVALHLELSLGPEDPAAVARGPDPNVTEQPALATAGANGTASHSTKTGGAEAPAAGSDAGDSTAARGAQRPLAPPPEARPTVQSDDRRSTRIHIRIPPASPVGSASTTAAAARGGAPILRRAAPQGSEGALAEPRAGDPVPEGSAPTTAAAAASGAPGVGAAAPQGSEGERLGQDGPNATDRYDMSYLRRLEEEEERKGVVIDGYPTYPGCFVRMPTGCRQHLKKTHLWRHDVWAERKNVTQDQCRQRKQFWDGYCDTSDVKMVFNGNAEQQEEAQARLEERKSWVIDGYPQHYGCYMRLPTGCPLHYKKTHWWRHDTAAEEHDLTESSCADRKRYWNDYCGTADAETRYVPLSGAEEAAGRPGAADEAEENAVFEAKMGQRLLGLMRKATEDLPTDPSQWGLTSPGPLLPLLLVASLAACRLGAPSWAIGGAAPRRGLGAAGPPPLWKVPSHRVRCRAVQEAAPPPPPRPPRERRMSEMEKQADAVVHAVVAVELLDWHGKLGGSLEHSFRKCVYTPVMPRLLRLTTRERSAFDDYRADGPNGRKISRPSRVHDATLERQFTLGNMFTVQALAELGRVDDARWLTRAQCTGRRELVSAEVEAGEDPAAKDLISWSEAIIKTPDGKEIQIRDRPNGHTEATFNIWVLPIFVDHDRNNHAERNALLLALEHMPMHSVHEGVDGVYEGAIRVYASHTPCISCLSSMCQFTRAWPEAKMRVTYDQWRSTRRWIGYDGPAEITRVDEDD